jgi:CRP-like cAMP-binding protein
MEQAQGTPFDGGVAATLRRLEVFEFLSDGHIATFADLVQHRSFAEGEVIFEEGTDASEFVIVIDGEVEAHLATPLGSQRAARLRPGDLIGEISLVDGKPRSSSVVGATDGAMLVFDAARFAQAAASDPTFEVGLLRTFCHSLANKIRQANDAMIQIMAPDEASSETTSGTGGERGTIDDDTKRDLLKEHGLTDHELQVLTAHLEAERFEGGDFIFTEGSEGDTLYIVADGEVRISRRIPGMGEEALAILGRGEIFGEMAWIDSSPRSADAIAHGRACTVLGVSRRRLEQDSGVDAASIVQFLKVLCQILCRRIRSMNGALVAWRTMAFFG